MKPRSQRSLLALSVVAVLTLAGNAMAQMPAAIAMPEEAIVVTLHAEGAQIYECKAGSDRKLAWILREPIATLLLDGKTVGRHYAGPNWEHMDGSAVTAKVLAHVPGKRPDDISWLKLRADSKSRPVVPRGGSGPLQNAGADDSRQRTLYVR